MAPRDGGRPVGELVRDGGVLVVIVGVVPPAPVVVATDATVPRSSLANCSLALGFDAGTLPPLPPQLMPLPVGSSAAGAPSSC